MARHLELTLCTTESIDRGRVVNANDENTGQYFDLLKQTMHEEAFMLALYGAISTAS